MHMVTLLMCLASAAHCAPCKLKLNFGLVHSLRKLFSCILLKKILARLDLYSLTGELAFLNTYL